MPLFMSQMCCSYSNSNGLVDRNRDSTGAVPRQHEPDEAVINYPNNAKFKSSFEQQYFEMMSRFQAALRVPNTGLWFLGGLSLRLPFSSPCMKSRTPMKVRNNSQLISSFYGSLRMGFQEGCGLYARSDVQLPRHKTTLSSPGAK
jgi:hypothetical protein